MDARLKLTSNISVIGSASDFTYKWALNAGMYKRDASRLALAVDEVVTNVVRFAFARQDGVFELEFHHDLSIAEVVIREFGEPFAPERHLYDRDRALTLGDFDGAGLELARRLADSFVFLNRGRRGKEFRLSKRIVSAHIADILPRYERDVLLTPRVGYRVRPRSETAGSRGYIMTDAKPDDAEDIAKLIFRTYGYTYTKDDVYFPEKVERSLRNDDRLGVVVRTHDHEPVAYFALLRSDDSAAGEVGEAVVTQPHRRRGIMTQMLNRLIEMARAAGLKALFGEAVTVHAISQKVNARFGFHTTALLLAEFPPAQYKHLVEGYPQHVSVAVDCLLLEDINTRDVYLPQKYDGLLRNIYARHDVEVNNLASRDGRPPELSIFETRIDYIHHYALLVVAEIGSDLSAAVTDTRANLFGNNTNTIYIDLPLSSQQIDFAVRELESIGFMFSGLMMLAHYDNDYLRLQTTAVDLDLDLIDVYSETGKSIKRRIEAEWEWITRKQKADSM